MRSPLRPRPERCSLPRMSGEESASPTPPPGGALHEDLHRDEEIGGPSDRKFGLTIGIVCGVIGSVRLVLGHSYWPWWLGVAALLIVLAMAAPAALGPLNWLWLRFGLVLYKIVNPVVMTVLYIVTIVPIGLLMRLFGKDPMRLRREPAASSYWIEREPPGPPPESMRNQF